MLIRGKDAALVFRKIQSLDVVSGSPAVDRRFLFLADGTARRFDWRVMPDRIKFWIVSRLYALRGIAFRVLPVPRQVIDIRVKNSVRLNHVAASGEIASVKMAIASRVRPGNLAREIAARRLFHCANPVVPVPRLIRYDRSRLEWIEEQYIARGPMSRSERAGTFLRLHADDFYRPFVRPRPVGHMLRIWNVTAAEIQGVFAEAGRPGVVDLQRTWPVALIHGDLSPGNLMADRQGRLFIVDLEKFGRGPIPWDLRKLYTDDRDLVLAVLRSNAFATDLEPENQMRVVMGVMVLVGRNRVTPEGQRVGPQMQKVTTETESERSRRENHLLSLIAADA